MYANLHQTNKEFLNIKFDSKYSKFIEVLISFCRDLVANWGSGQYLHRAKITYGQTVCQYLQ